MYISPSEVAKAVSVRESKGSLFREVITIQDMIDSLEVNEADDEVDEACPKCGAYVWCEHQDIIKADKENDEYWAGILAEKNENRSL